MGMRWGQQSVMLNIAFRYYFWRVDQGTEHQNFLTTKKPNLFQGLLTADIVMSCEMFISQ